MFVIHFLKSKLKLFLLIPLSIIVSMHLLGQNSIVTKADQELRNQNFTEAIQLYQQSESAGLISTDMYYNLSLAQYQSDQVAQAVVSLQKALKLNPGNIKAAKQYNQILNDHPEIEPSQSEFFITQTWKKIAAVFMPSTWMWISLLTMLIIGSIFYRYFPSDIRRQKPAIAILAALFLIFSMLGISRNVQLYHNKTIVITARDTTIKVGPDEDSPDLAPITSGSVVYYINKLPGWWRVKNSYGDEGWIQVTQGTRI